MLFYGVPIILLIVVCVLLKKLLIILYSCEKKIRRGTMCCDRSLVQEGFYVKSSFVFYALCQRF